jgi:transcription elongation factor GreA
MASAELLELVEQGALDQVDNRCLELAQEGSLSAKDLTAVIEKLRAAGHKERVPELMPTLIEAGDWAQADPQALLKLAKTAMACAPQDPALREFLVEAYRRAYGDQPGFETILTASGLTAGRPFRNACKTMDLGMQSEVGDFLINSMDDHAVELVEVDRANGLFALRREGRTSTVPAAEIARDYEPVDANDFRVLRQLQPERLSELIEKDPVALVIGLIHAHGDHIDQDLLHDELVPRYLSNSEWSKWWSKTRTKLKRNKHIIIEGRAPVVLSYSDEGQTLEDELIEAFEKAKEPSDWAGLVQKYVRDKAATKETPDSETLKQLADRLGDHFKRARGRRPAEALATALVLHQIEVEGLADEGARLASELLEEEREPLKLVAALDDPGQWPPALEALRTASAEEYPRRAAALIGKAPAGLLDRLAADAIAGGELSGVQKWIEKALDEPVKYPDIIYWLWKGPAVHEGLRLPEDHLLFDEILTTLLALGRTLDASANETRDFRQKMRQALALKSYAKARQCLEATEYGRGITLKTQLNRLEGLGENVRAELINILRDKHPELYLQPVAKRLEPWEQPDVVYATKAGIDKRTAERDEIQNVQMRENAKRIGEAASLGDLSENSEYKFALEERDLLRARLADINNELSIAEAVNVLDVPVDYVGIGSKVTLRQTESGETSQITFLGPFDANVEAGIYNYKAPLSQKILGHRVGDRVVLTIDGIDCEYEITQIESGLATG